MPYVCYYICYNIQENSVLYRQGMMFKEEFEREVVQKKLFGILVYQIIDE